MANCLNDDGQEVDKDETVNTCQEIGLQIWCIDGSTVKPLPKERYGEFYGRHSYVMLRTTQNGGGGKMTTHDVFVWLGINSSQDEAGAAADKVTELDDLFGGDLVQYRQVQGNESKKFLSCFQKVTILEGSVGGDFRNVKPEEYAPRLLHVTGFDTQHVQVYQVKLDAHNLNNAHSFVLDCGHTVYQFNGANASSWDKRRASAVVAELEASRYGHLKKTVVVAGLEQGDYTAAVDNFWAYFGGKPASIPDVGKVQKKETESNMPMSMYRIFNEYGVVEIKQVCSGTLDKSKLASNALIVDTNGECVFVWIGKGVSKAVDKKEAMTCAVRFLSERAGGHVAVPIVRVFEDKEPVEFWSAFNHGQVVTKLTSIEAGGTCYDRLSRLHLFMSERNGDAGSYAVVDEFYPGGVRGFFADHSQCINEMEDGRLMAQNKPKAACANAEACTAMQRRRGRVRAATQDPQDAMVTEMTDTAHIMMHHLIDMGVRSSNDDDDAKSNAEEDDSKEHAPLINSAKFITHFNGDASKNKYPSYSFGVRFFYHSYFKDKHTTQEILPGTRLLEDGNRHLDHDYNLSSWYIAAQYASIKEEVLNCIKAVVSKQVLDELLARAELGLRQIGRTIAQNQYHDFNEVYNIEEDAPID